MHTRCAEIGTVRVHVRRIKSGAQSRFGCSGRLATRSARHHARRVIVTQHVLQVSEAAVVRHLTSGIQHEFAGRAVKAAAGRDAFDAKLGHVVVRRAAAHADHDVDRAVDLVDQAFDGRIVGRSGRIEAIGARIAIAIEPLDRFVQRSFRDRIENIPPVRSGQSRSRPHRRLRAPRRSAQPPARCRNRDRPPGPSSLRCRRRPYPRPWRDGSSPRRLRVGRHSRSPDHR